MLDESNAPDQTTLAQAGPTAKYTKLLPPDEFEKLTLEEKSEYITAMTQLLKARWILSSDR